METQTDQRPYPAAMVNITNRCTLACKHCFVFRNANPNDPHEEMSSERMVQELARLQQKHGIQTMLWMGGEPLLRKDVLLAGTPYFQRNNVTTNGTLDLIELPNCTYVISIDGPPKLNDAIRGKATFDRVMKTLAKVNDSFAPTVMGQCVVTAQNQDYLEETLLNLEPTRLDGMTFSFYVPSKNDSSGLNWKDQKERDQAVFEVMRLKKKYPAFVWNNWLGLELTLSQNCKKVTDNCPSKQYVLPLYLEKEKFVRPFCCYGNDVDCDMCGAWVVFYIAAKIESMGPQFFRQSENLEILAEYSNISIF